MEGFSITGDRVGGLEQMFSAKSDVVDAEYEDIKEDPAKQHAGNGNSENRFKKYYNKGKDLGLKVLNYLNDKNFLFNSAVTIYYGTLMGYYYGCNNSSVGVTGLIGTLPHYFEACKKESIDRKVGDGWYWGSAVGYTIAGISKIAISQKDGTVNENMFFWPAMVDFWLAGYQLIKKLELPKKIKK